MKKLIALLLAVLMVLGMAACASTPKPAENNNQTEEPAQDAEQTAEPEGKKFEGKTLTMMMSMSESNATDAYYAQIAAFEEKYGCKVDVEAIPHGDEGENLKLVRLATGTLADIYQTSVGAKFDEFSPTENCVDISGEAWANNISDGYRSVVTYDGGVYATPIPPTLPALSTTPRCLQTSASRSRRHGTSSSPSARPSRLPASPRSPRPMPSRPTPRSPS